ARSDAVVPVRCRPAPVRHGPWQSMSLPVLPVSEYRPALRGGAPPTCPVGMPLLGPWRQGMLRAAVIATMKFSLAERILERSHFESVGPGLGAGEGGLERQRRGSGAAGMRFSFFMGGPRGSPSSKAG